MLGKKKVRSKKLWVLKDWKQVNIAHLVRLVKIIPLQWDQTIWKSNPWQKRKGTTNAHKNFKYVNDIVEI